MDFQKQFDIYRNMVNDEIDRLFYKRESLQKNVYGR